MITLAFITVLLAAPLILQMTASASGEGAATLAPLIIDLTVMTDAQIGAPVPHVWTLRSRFLIVTPQATIAIQSGNVPKHFHLGSNEIPYISSRSGSFWLGGMLKTEHPGDLMIIPKDTPHAGSLATASEFKAIAIKIPPQAA